MYVLLVHSVIRVEYSSAALVSAERLKLTGRPQSLRLTGTIRSTYVSLIDNERRYPPGSTGCHQIVGIPCRLTRPIENFTEQQQDERACALFNRTSVNDHEPLPEKQRGIYRAPALTKRTFIQCFLCEATVIGPEVEVAMLQYFPKQTIHLNGLGQKNSGDKQEGAMAFSENGIYVSICVSCFVVSCPVLEDAAASSSACNLESCSSVN
ncbi:hypothetical protein K0M31_000691 [Melipona bicolor]|uniref:Uncharacterized protein n=1 Tax=Melipona bicolor TaxID=60889 RepID=A0AA40GE10_9HYME|nr:hypothetical protein K0M31_000691 [Melipona bicolor]